MATTNPATLTTTAPIGSTPATARPTVPTTSSTPPTTAHVAAESRALPTTVEKLPELPGFAIYRPTDLDATGSPMPVIAWGSGGCVRFDSLWQPLLDRWAGAGFIVVAISLPAGVSDPRDAPPFTVDDQAKAIDWAFAAASAPGPYRGHLDLDRVVAAGNSCGGVTALQLAARDKRVNAVFVLSGSSVLPGSPRSAAAAIMGTIHVPVGYITGGPDDISRPNVAQDYSLVPPGVAAYVAHRSIGDHVTVSTHKDVLIEDAEVSIKWIDFSLYGDATTRERLVTTPCGSCAPGTWSVESKDLDTVPAS